MEHLPGLLKDAGLVLINITHLPLTYLHTPTKESYRGWRFSGITLDLISLTNIHTGIQTCNMYLYRFTPRADLIIGGLDTVGGWNFKIWRFLFTKVRYVYMSTFLSFYNVRIYWVTLNSHGLMISVAAIFQVVWLKWIQKVCCWLFDFEMFFYIA